MKIAGDIPQEVRDCMNELTEFEKFVDSDPFTPEHKAKLYICAAHDWFMLDMDEEGQRLISKASQICPSYFTEYVIQHQVESPNFAIVIKNLTGELRNLLLDALRNK